MTSPLQILAADLARLPDETPMRIVAAGGGANATHLCNDHRALKAIRARNRVATILAERPEGALEILCFGPGTVLALWTRRLLLRREQRTVAEALLPPKAPARPSLPAPPRPPRSRASMSLMPAPLKPPTSASRSPRRAASPAVPTPHPRRPGGPPSLLRPP